MTQSDFAKYTSGAKEELEALANQEWKKREERSRLAKVGGVIYETAKNLATPATVGAVIGGISSGTLDGAIEGAQQGVILASPFVAYSIISGSLANREKRRSRYVAEKNGNIYLQERPVAAVVAGSIVGSLMYVASSVVIDIFAGTNFSAYTSAQVGGLTGVYSALKGAWKGKRSRDTVEARLDQ